MHLKLTGEFPALGPEPALALPDFLELIDEHVVLSAFLVEASLRPRGLLLRFREALPQSAELRCTVCQILRVLSCLELPADGAILFL